MLSKSKISNSNSTSIPAQIRHKFNISPGDILLWDIKNDKIILEHRKKITLNDIDGIISVGGDAVKSKKKSQSGA